MGYEVKMGLGSHDVGELAKGLVVAKLAQI